MPSHQVENITNDSKYILYAADKTHNRIKCSTPHCLNTGKDHDMYQITSIIYVCDECYDEE